MVGQLSLPSRNELVVLALTPSHPVWQGIFAQTEGNAKEVPGAGAYDAINAIAHAAASGPCAAAFRGTRGRFEGPNTIYSTTDAPGVGTYDIASTQSRGNAATSFLGTTDRFGGPSSLYKAGCGPGAGAYQPHLAECAR